ncbi:SubName: Full=Uncharacterized protein {ECO:0000313/EMBL:CCA76236.1} [Serendipita indica DSM 11827]|uniref:HAT C-terminal dimerisation domain-containing protein n=1 Tax=Serendipita indica (strain DSM 11827) TaxID=1109443 RepID=G4TY43_SERID|nr:SubName: Full=Uncharacterized protein {ECO:0000313/EMBL:CCA76236.1} [Serendipita indica DSM 11827]CCA76236.1 hypothetical protein PIIN_10228 [Serendipita indica DSM 11827]
MPTQKRQRQPQSSPTRRATLPQARTPANVRSDIWSFARPVENKIVYNDVSVVLPPHQYIPYRPKSRYVGCIPCEDVGRRTLWANDRTAQTTNLANHLRTHENWEESCLKRGIKPKPTSNKFDDNLSTLRSRPLNQDGVLYFFLRWIVIDDQPLSIVESKEFRQFFFYCCRDLNETDLPHKDKVRNGINTLFKKKQSEWMADAQNCPGRVSFTTDLWTDNVLHAFMAITAHFITEKVENGSPVWKMESRLISFKNIIGSHTGEALGQAFVDILTECGLAHKVGRITADNASNNRSMTMEIEAALQRRGIEFDTNEQYLRCFPHTINLVVQTFLDHIKDIPANAICDTTIHAALLADPVARCRNLVATLRLTSNRRDEYRRVLKKAIEDGNFEGKPLELIRDMVVRWSSTYNMIIRYLTMEPGRHSTGLLHYPLLKVVDLMLNKPAYHKINKDLNLSEEERRVLQDIQRILLLFHSIQELVSSEQTPTLSIAIPTYEFCASTLSKIIIDNIYPSLEHALHPAVAKLDKYIRLARSNRVYGLAMVLNPASKMDWIQKHWSDQDVERCRESLIDSVAAFRKKELLSQQKDLPALDAPNSNRKATSKAHANLDSGFCCLSAIADLALQPSKPTLQSSTQPHPPSAFPVLTAEQIDARAREDAIREVQRYLNEPLVEHHLTGVDLLKFWQDKHLPNLYPNLRKVALDILPVQASSVPCERVFSSAKHTATSTRAQSSPRLIEMLQILKYGL